MQLAGDIGGTKTILMLLQQDPEGGGIQTLWEQRYQNQDFVSLEVMVQIFLEASKTRTENDGHPTSACFAVAGPVVDNTCTLSNINWYLQGSQLELDLAIETVALINDFAAVGYGVPVLPSTDLLTLQAGIPQPHSPKAVIGAGTGLGEAFLIQQGTHYTVFATEGGHTDFAPRTELEFQLFKFLQKRYGHVSVERVVSGRGIVSIYEFLRDDREIPPSPELDRWVRHPQDQDPAALIAEAALSQSDPLSEQTLRLFVEAYGAEVGNLALKLLPYGGIYVAGGIAAKILPLIQRGEFMHNFGQKGRMTGVLEKIPVHIVLNPRVGLLGAAHFATQLTPIHSFR